MGILDEVSEPIADDGEDMVSVAAGELPDVEVVSEPVVLVPLAQLNIVMANVKAAQTAAVLNNPVVCFMI